MSRVMSHYLNLANVAETHHRIRTTRYSHLHLLTSVVLTFTRYHALNKVPLKFSCSEILKSLVNDGIPKDKIYGKFMREYFS